MTVAYNPLEKASAHKLVADIAKGFAAEVYQAFARKSNDFFKANPDEAEYIRQNWPYYCESTRATLATMLTTNTPDVLKNQIHEALLLDNALRMTREHLQVMPL